MAKRKVRTISGLLVLVTLVAGLIGVFLNVPREILYESRVEFQISPNWVVGEGVSEQTTDQLIELCNLPHEERVVSKDCILYCLDTCNLFVLDCFRGLTKEECIDLIHSRAKATRLTSSGMNFELSLPLQNPRDTAIILNNLVDSYSEEQLFRKYPKLGFQFEYEPLKLSLIHI